MQYRACRHIHKMLCPVKCDFSGSMLPRGACGSTYKLVEVLMGLPWPYKGQKVSHFLLQVFKWGFCSQILKYTFFHSSNMKNRG